MLTAVASSALTLVTTGKRLAIAAGITGGRRGRASLKRVSMYAPDCSRPWRADAAAFARRIGEPRDVAHDAIGSARLGRGPCPSSTQRATKTFVSCLPLGVARFDENASVLPSGENIGKPSKPGA